MDWDIFIQATFTSVLVFFSGILLLKLYLKYDQKRLQELRAQQQNNRRR